MTAKRSREAIAVSTEVKEGLATVNDLLEQQLGSRLSYNEVIAFLLLQYNKSDSPDQLDLFIDKSGPVLVQEDKPDANNYGEFETL
jgi:hypothetical protein|tara:strand:- start:300 stop:557 length:258 start_codon:yes stop_codon:yes gene_type:complete